MKVFEIPEVEFIQFGQADIVAVSPCVNVCACVDCTACPPGSNDCGYHDFCPSWVYDPNCLSDWINHKP